MESVCFCLSGFGLNPSLVRRAAAFLQGRSQRFQLAHAARWEGGGGSRGSKTPLLSHLDPSLCQFLERPHCHTYHWPNSFWWFGNPLLILLATPLASLACKASNGGIPQGTKLRPILFGVIIDDLVRSWGPRVKYVDDLTILEVIPRNSPSLMRHLANCTWG